MQNPDKNCLNLKSKVYARVYLDYGNKSSLCSDVVMASKAFAATILDQQSPKYRLRPTFYVTWLEMNFGRLLVIVKSNQRLKEINKLNRCMSCINRSDYVPDCIDKVVSYLSIFIWSSSFVHTCSYDLYFDGTKAALG